MLVDHAPQDALAAALLKHREKDLATAESLYRQVLQARPDHPDALHLIGIIAFQQNRLPEAIDLFRRALNVHPCFAAAWHNLGKALHCQGRTDQAAVAYHRAIALAPELTEACCDYGTLLAEHGRIDDAIVAYRQALSQRPELALAHYNLSLLLLLKGDYSQGWREHEWRWKAPEIGLIQRAFTQPQWTGEDLNGRRVLLHAEQGFGDAIQFLRYAPLIAARGGRVIVECHEALCRLIKSIPGIEQVVAEDTELPEFDFHCPLQSLPSAMRTTLQTIPSQGPYIFADPILAEKWASRIDSDTANLKVGLVWAGRSNHDNDCNRSLALKDLEPLSHAAGVSFYSLQKGETASQADTEALGAPIINFTHDLNDFADTAALIANLDLVITVDTSVAHLAGAMGKPVWIMLPFIPDWRWMRDRTDSPWYPTARLFRQPAPGDWKSPMQEVLQALRLAADAPEDGEIYGQGDMSMHPTPSRTTPRRITRLLVARPSEQEEAERRDRLNGGKQKTDSPPSVRRDLSD